MSSCRATNANPPARGPIATPPPAPNAHPDGCHAANPLALRDCTSDGHHECVTRTRFDAAGREARGDDQIGRGEVS